MAEKEKRITFDSDLVFDFCDWKCGKGTSFQFRLEVLGLAEELIWLIVVVLGLELALSFFLFFFN